MTKINEKKVENIPKPTLGAVIDALQRIRDDFSEDLPIAITIGKELFDLMEINVIRSEKGGFNFVLISGEKDKMEDKE